MNDIDWWSVARILYSLVWFFGAWATYSYFRSHMEPYTTEEIIIRGTDEYLLKTTRHRYPSRTWYHVEAFTVVGFVLLSIPMFLLWAQGVLW